jgi:hypothetical protein
VFTKDDICTLANVVIVSPTRADLFLHSCVIQRFVTFDLTQAKEKSFHNRHPIDQFLPLAIEVFVCLHDYANAIWSLKGLESFHLSTLVIFFVKKF